MTTTAMATSEQTITATRQTSSYNKTVFSVINNMKSNFMLSDFIWLNDSWPYSTKNSFYNCTVWCHPDKHGIFESVLCQGFSLFSHLACSFGIQFNLKCVVYILNLYFSCKGALQQCWILKRYTNKTELKVWSSAHWSSLVLLFYNN